MKQLVKLIVIILIVSTTAHVASAQDGNNNFGVFAQGGCRSNFTLNLEVFVFGFTETILSADGGVLQMAIGGIDTDDFDVFTAPYPDYGRVDKPGWRGDNVWSCTCIDITGQGRECEVLHSNNIAIPAGWVFWTYDGVCFFLPEEVATLDPDDWNCIDSFMQPCQ